MKRYCKFLGLGMKHEFQNYLWLLFVQEYWTTPVWRYKLKDSVLLGMILCQLVHSSTAVGTSVLTYKLHFTELSEFSIFGRIHVHVCLFLSPQKAWKFPVQVYRLRILLWSRKSTLASEKSDGKCMEIQEFRNTMPCHIKISLGHSVSNRIPTMVHSVI